MPSRRQAFVLIVDEGIRSRHERTDPHSATTDADILRIRRHQINMHIGSPHKEGVLNTRDVGNALLDAPAVQNGVDLFTIKNGDQIAK